MARITARQAFTRAKSKRTRDKSVTEKALLEARRKYIRQLNNVGIDVEGTSQQTRHENPTLPIRKSATTKKRSPARSLSQSKKITDYFTVTKNLELIPRLGKPPTRTFSSRDANGIEIITIDEPNFKVCDSNNNHYDNTENNISLESLNSSDWNTSSDSSRSGSTTAEQQHSPHRAGHLKPLRCKLDLSNLGTSFEELNIKVHVDEDIEIVDMLPPIPLRKHPVFDIE